VGLESDPVSMILHSCMAWSMCAAREYQEAIEYARRSMEIDANFSLIWVAMGFAQLGTGCAQEAIASFRRVVELASWRWTGPTGLACAYWQTGDRERSRECIRTLSGWQLELGEAIYYAYTGDADAMFDAIERAYQRRDYLTLYMDCYDLYRDDPRFKDLLRRMHLT
jgi:tetratricopeptide (TPR) repeat protein